MGAWGIKALERDEGLDVLDILKNEYVPEHPVMDLGEMIELMKEEVMLGSDFSQIDFLFDNTAMALAELYFQWKDNGKLDYDHEEAIWDKVTGFTASKEALAFLLRQLTDIKNEVPDEDGIREIVDLWKNEDSGEIAPAWLEHLNQLIDRLDSEQEARQMYIKKYWGNFIGGSDDSLNLVAFLEDQKKEEIPLSEIFSKIGLDKQNWDFRQTVEYLEFTHSDGVEMDFHFAIDVVTDLAAILLECSVSGSVNLQDLDEYNTPARRIRITATPEEHDAMNKALADFVHAPLEYDLSEMMDNEEIQEMARDVEALRKELYEAAGRNRDYYVKAEDMKNLLPDWEGADGCIATNRITMEGYKVGYCYRENPDGGWDSGWRFTAGDESEAYMDDPNNAGIYKLNTICNDDPDIISLLNTPAPCAFERDENGVFQQIKDWKPDEDEEDPDMDILKQCQKWHEESKQHKIIDALEAIPAEERTPEMDSELARAYNNLADPHKPTCKEMLKKALALLKPHEEYFEDDYYWNFRMGYSYFYLDQEGRALRYFEKALEARPGDDDTKEFIERCKKGISLPQFWECFRDRTENWWETFAEMEAELRQMMDDDKDHTRGAELVAQMEETLNLAFDEISFEMGFNGEKYELILTPEGDKVKLFELVYFQKHAPKEVLEHWNILVGRQPLQNIGLRTEDGWDISGDDVQIWLEEQGENSFAISAYCEKLLPMLREAEGRVWWMLTTLTDQVLGEIPHMRYIDSFDVLEEPRAEPSILMSQLPDALKERGLELSTDPEAYLESYLGYEMKPNEDPDADWRLDVMAGSTCCVPLINGYLNADNDFMDDLHADGAVAGFFCYPLDTLREKEGTQKIFDFRDKLEELFTTGDGPEVLTLTGGATGLYCGYVDFIAWDIQTALQMAKNFFEDSDIPWASFHTFRREAGTVNLKTPSEEEPDDEDQAPELDETLAGMDYIPYTPQNEEEYFQQLEQWNDEDEYTRCIQALNAIPEDWRNYRIAYAMARALENYAIIGDHDEGTLKFKGDKALQRAIEVLESVREEGQDKAEWNMRMAYGYQYLYGQEEQAIPYAQRWAELDPEDENAPAVIRECKAEIRKRQRSRKKKAKFVPGDTPFEGFDLTNFWDDNWYALKEYVSDPPSDELIASVEEELGYKLPAAYIWLMKQHNGGIPMNTCYPCDEPTCWADDHVAITGIFGIGREKNCSLCGEMGSQFMIDEWEYPAIGVAICDCPSAGHDMIFLDYRACGPQGEPAVVHVDQENDYKITHLADSFEEFIRGLEHESLYDPDEDVEDLEDDADEEKTDRKGSFAGSVLLSKAEWDKEQLIRNLREEWGIVDEEPDEGDEDDENSDDAVVMRVGGMMLIVTLFHGHIPDNEAEINAENNYMWPEAVEVTKAHKAHIMVAVLGEEEKLLERGKLFTKAMAVCCKQKYATGVYTSGVVFEPRFYEGLADMIKEDELPIFNWVWFGLYRSEGGLNGYTYGMDVFGKEEMEVLNTDAEPEELRDFLASLASYVLACDVTLQDGETIGFSADDKHTITRSPGVSLPEEQMTLKISYEPTEVEPETDDDSIGMDDVSYHIESIEEKELPIDPINAYNHMAIYLRWCMEHDLMGEKFLEEHGDVVNQVKADPGSTDLRTFIREELFGCLFSALFNQKGRAFAHYYYGENDAPYYPADIDDYALKYFGPSRYHSNEFQQEAYLFIPFDEDYYQAMAEVIEERFTNWQGQDFDEDTLEPSEVAQAIMEYLDCECTYFPSMADDDPIMSAYSYARRLGVREDFIPVLIKPDETLLECLVMNADPENDADCYEFNPKAVEEYRKKMLSAPVKDGKAVLEELTGQRKEEAEEDDMDWEEEIIGEIDGGINNDRFASYWDSDTNMTVPLILAKIPVKNPWEIFAYLPFGNWNECPDTLELMAVAKYWFEQYDAVPAAMSHDELEFLLPAPVPKEKAIDVAVEQYGFCPDLDQNASIGTLADTIHQSTVWYFWWD